MMRNSNGWFKKGIGPLKTNRQLLLKTCAVACLVSFTFYTVLRDQNYRVNLPRIWNRWYRPCKELPQQSSSHKTVLLWTNFFAHPNWLPSTDELNCTFKECVITYNRSHWAESSAVLVHWRDLTDSGDLASLSDGANCPILVLFNKEAPPHTPVKNIDVISDRVDWVATYRRDSDIYAPYGFIVEKKIGGNTKIEMPAPSDKKNLVCWLVSNCKTSSQREIYVSDLQRHVPVEIYGKCGNSSCPNSDSMDCYKWLSTRCKFYLSFENAICKDYVTEKLFHAMMAGMVPVVLGGTDYARYLPEHSFIDVADFKDSGELARYLVELDQDDGKYLEYFAWRRTHAVEFVPYHWFCDLCEKLHSVDRKQVHPRKNLVSWWYDEANCGSLA